MKKHFALFLIFLVLLLNSLVAHAYTKEDVLQRGHLNCGVSSDSPGFSQMDATGLWSGLHIDFCRAVAAAVLGDQALVKFIPVRTTGAYTALLAGKVDLLLRHGAGAGWDFTHDTALAINFVGVSYYDELGLMSSQAIGEVDELKEVELCKVEKSSGSDAAELFLEQHKIKNIAVTAANEQDAGKKFLSGECSLIAMPISELIGLQSSMKEKGTILPEKLGRISFGPVVRQGDDGWFDIVRWTLFVLLDGESLGLSSANIDEMRVSGRPEVRRFFGYEGSGGKSLGLADDWAAKVIGQVGNYGEIFERNLGQDSLNLDRGANSLWKNGGLMYAPQFR